MVTVRPNGAALLSAAVEGSNFKLDYSIPGAEVAARVERVIESYLRDEPVTKEETTNEPEPTSNPV
jgi:hypothetical protein